MSKAFGTLFWYHYIDQLFFQLNLKHKYSYYFTEDKLLSTSLNKLLSRQQFIGDKSETPNVELSSDFLALQCLRSCVVNLSTESIKMGRILFLLNPLSVTPFANILNNN